MGFKCGICGKYHDEFPMDLAYRRPGDFFKIPKSERNKRIYLNEDICVIDDKEFFIRGILELPVNDYTDNFRFGTWAKISQKDFEKYTELWDATEIDEPPFLGKLSGGVGFYEDTDMLDINVFLQANKDRPIFVVMSNEHPLGMDQKQGIFIEKVHKFVEPILSQRKLTFWQSLFRRS